MSTGGFATPLWGLALLTGAACLTAAACSSPAAPSQTPPPQPTSTTTAPPQTAIEVALTVDDLPIHGPDVPGLDRQTIAERMIATFAAHRLPPVHGFVNGKKVDDDPATETILRRWVESGNRLGNHTWSHPSLHELALPDYIADIERGEPILRKLAPDSTWKLFRYPFLHEGDTPDKREGARKYLSEHGYTIAEVTIDADDWAYNPPYARCTAKGDTAALAELTRAFVEGHVEELHRVRALAHTLVGRDVRHILLLHIGAADAAALDALLTAYEREGVRWIDLPTALSDPFYTLDPAKPYPFGAAFPYLLARSRAIKAPPPIFARDLEARLEATCN